jgi:hypothetical protein
MNIKIISESRIKRMIESEIRKNNNFYNKTLDKLRNKIIELEKRTVRRIK